MAMMKLIPCMLKNSIFKGILHGNTQTPTFLSTSVLDLVVITVGDTHVMAGAGAGQVTDGDILVEVSVTATVGAGAGVIQDMAGVIRDMAGVIQDTTTLLLMVRDMRITQVV